MIAESFTAQQLATAPPRAGAKTRLRGIHLGRRTRLWHRALSSHRPHWAFAAVGRRNASGPRSYYDPSIGRYLQPEPLLSEPGFVVNEAMGGYSAAAYAYARNNPVNVVDADGLTPKGARKYLDDHLGKEPNSFCLLNPGACPNSPDPGGGANSCEPETQSCEVNACLNACKAGKEVVVNYCYQNFPEKSRFLCSGLAFASQVLCNGFCYRFCTPGWTSP